MQPKEPAEFMKLVTDHIYFDQPHRDWSKRSLKMGFNDQIGPHKLFAEKDFRFWPFHDNVHESRQKYEHVEISHLH